MSSNDRLTQNQETNRTRVSKTVNGTTSYFIYEGHKLLGEYDTNGNVINEYVYLGSTAVAMSTTTKTYKIYTDHLNTPRRVADENNNIVWKWESTPFGETKPTGTLEFNLRFAGQYYDNETTTHYNINRDYNPITGRYIQSDPIGLDGGFSTFAYVNGNPVMLVDLEGLFGGSDDSNFEPTRLYSCDSDSGFAVLNAKNKIERGDYSYAFRVLRISDFNQRKYVLNLQRFGNPCILQMAGTILGELAMQLKPPTTPASGARFLIKATYLGKKERGKNIEVRFVSNGNIEVWRVAE